MDIQDQSFKDILTKTKFPGHIIKIFHGYFSICICIVIALSVAKMFCEPNIICKIMKYKHSISRIGNIRTEP